MYEIHLVIYLNRENKTICRINKGLIFKKIGETTSMGWQILDIQYYCEKLGMFVNEKTMNEIMLESQEKKFKKSKRMKRKTKILENIYEIFK